MGDWKLGLEYDTILSYVLNLWVAQILLSKSTM